MHDTYNKNCDKQLRCLWQRIIVINEKSADICRFFLPFPPKMYGVGIFLVFIFCLHYINATTNYVDIVLLTSINNQKKNLSSCLQQALRHGATLNESDSLLLWGTYVQSFCQIVHYLLFYKMRNSYSTTMSSSTRTQKGLLYNPALYYSALAALCHVLTSYILY